jgi:hypothetical protein
MILSPNEDISRKENYMPIFSTKSKKTVFNSTLKVFFSKIN